MSLHDRVRVARRFQRSIRIDTDLDDATSLEGFVCPPSSADVLASMARHLRETGHGAFTWTGPYGSGKSSLVIALSAALSGKSKVREAAARALGDDVVAELHVAMPPKLHGWRIVPVVGSRAPLAQCLGESLEAGGLAKRIKSWTDAAVMQHLAALVADRKSHAGLLIIVDELGKVLEGAAFEGHDIFLLQRIAELASRSDGRLVLIGVLHQAFDEYAQRLTREARDEWAKIQGRFIDLVVNATGDEQVELLARAIETSGKVQLPEHAIEIVAKMMSAGRASSSRRINGLLRKCWPLHPTVAALLGPLSRRRFGQNQRSLFAFLNSAEPVGFQDFLENATAADLYGPDRLWDYLRANLEPSILASADGHRWSVGVDALERCATAGAAPLEISLLKTIILVDLFRERSGLAATAELLGMSVRGAKPKEIERALQNLSDRSCVVFRRHVDAYGLFAGSDFDIEDALARATPAPDAVDLGRLRDLAGLQSVLAKRHYHDTGAIRWFNLELVRLSDLKSIVKETKDGGAAGRFLIAIPTHGETPAKAEAICSAVAAAPDTPLSTVVGMSGHAWHVIELAREFMALRSIHEERPELRGDAVARREVLARLSETQARLERELQRMADETLWYRHGETPQKLAAPELNALASALSDKIFCKAPRVLNELLNRDFPSSSAVKAQRDLMKRMLDSAGKPRLGLSGWPAEAGLMQSLLIATGLYCETPDGDWKFVTPTAKHDLAGLAHLWQTAIKHIKSAEKSPISVASLYDLWRKPPFGIKSGLLPVLALALYITQRDRLAVYRQGVFQPDLTELDVDLVTSDPSHLGFRWIELSGTTREILTGLAQLASSLDPCGRASSGEPLDVARSLVSAFDQLPMWTKRTSHITPAAQRLATLLRYASDPNRLLFEDLPGLSDVRGRGNSPAQVIDFIKRAFKDLRLAYPKMLQELENTLFEELEVDERDRKSIQERASNLLEATGDLRLRAFINRLSSYKGSDTDVEAIAGLAIDKRPSDWVDADLVEARRRLGELAQDFKRHEEIARVSGRPDTRHRMSIIVPKDGAPRALHKEFVVNAHDNAEIAQLIAKLDGALQRSNRFNQNIILAALAQVSARYMQPVRPQSPPRRKVG